MYERTSNLSAQISTENYAQEEVIYRLSTAKIRQFNIIPFTGQTL